MRIAVCDYNTDDISEISSIITSYPNIDSSFVSSFTNGTDMIQMHKTCPFDIIFMDVIFPDCNGIEIANEIRKFDKAVKIIYLASTSDYAITAYSVKSSGYLLKPINAEVLHDLLKEIIPVQAKDNVTVRTKFSVIKISPESISYIENYGIKSILTLIDGKTMESVDSIKTFMEQLTDSGNFIKCHKNYLVNISNISSFTDKEIKMQSNHIIPIGTNIDFEKSYFDAIFQYTNC